MTVLRFPPKFVIYYFEGVNFSVILFNITRPNIGDVNCLQELHKVL